MRGMVPSFGTSARIPNNLGAFRRVSGQDTLPHHGHSEKQLLCGAVYYELRLYMDLWNNEIVRHAVHPSEGAA